MRYFRSRRWALSTLAKAGAILPFSSLSSPSVGQSEDHLISKPLKIVHDSQVTEYIDWVTPEAFGAVGNGHAANANTDTAAIQRAINTGKPVRVTAGKNYVINAELTPPVGIDLVLTGTRGSGSGSACLTAMPGFTGYLLRPRAGYDIRDLKITGSNLDGCYLIGSPDKSSTGMARLERLYLTNADIGVKFGESWNHPWGLFYNQLTGVGFRSGGINLGGQGDSESSGESAWSMDNINFNASPSSSGIPAPNQVVKRNTPSNTCDTVAWNNLNSPIYGWCVMRSADGYTKWHVPPNWSSPGLNSDSFIAEKFAGETWHYMVVRMTRGLHIRRAKAVSLTVAQLEYFGIGIYTKDVSGVSISQFYSEIRDKRPYPLPMYVGIFADDSMLSVGGGWCENFGYGIISYSNSSVCITGPLRINNCKWGKGARGGSTSQAMLTTAELRASGTTPDIIKPLTSSVYDHAGAGIEFDRMNNTMVHYIDGAEGNAYEVRRRGSSKVRLFANKDGEGVIRADRAIILQPNKTLTPPLINAQNFTRLSSGTSIPFLTIAGIPSNSATALTFLVHIGGVDDESVYRQSCVCRLDIALVDASGDNTTIAVMSSPEAKAIQTGNMTSPVFTASAENGIVTISCNVESSMPELRLYPSVISAAGSSSSHVIVNQI